MSKLATSACSFSIEAANPCKSSDLSSLTNLSRFGHVRARLERVLCASGAIEATEEIVVRASDDVSVRETFR